MAPLRTSTMSISLVLEMPTARVWASGDQAMEEGYHPSPRVSCRRDWKLVPERRASQTSKLPERSERKASCCASGEMEVALLRCREGKSRVGRGRLGEGG